MTGTAHCTKAPLGLVGEEFAKQRGSCFSVYSHRVEKLTSLKRFSSVAAFGFSSGLPLLLTASTLQAWMVDEKVDIAVIGLFSLVGLPYTLKFLWAPLMDRYVPPFLGRRRGWMLVSQLALILAIAATGFSRPASKPMIVAALVLAVAFFSATQDVAVDAYNTELLRPEEYGLGSTVYATAYRAAMVVSGSLALILADHLPWKAVYLLMAAAMLFGVAASFLAPEPQLKVKPPASLREAVVCPLREFFGRPGAWEILLFIVIYRVDYNMIWNMTTPFVLAAGFSKTDVGVVTKGIGMGATIAGGLLGGGLMMRLGLMRALVAFGIAQAATGASYLALAHLGRSYPMMVTAITLENLCGGMANAALTAFMMTLCDKRYTATQYALITSFMALSRYAGSAPSGFLVKWLGWPTFFMTCVFAGIPALLMLTRFGRWAFPDEETPSPPLRTEQAEAQAVQREARPPAL